MKIVLIANRVEADESIELLIIDHVGNGIGAAFMATHEQDRVPVWDSVMVVGNTGFLRWKVMQWSFDGRELRERLMQFTRLATGQVLSDSLLPLPLSPLNHSPSLARSLA